MKKTIRWGIIGCGSVTELKSGPAYQNVDGFELVAVMRRDAAKAADYARRHGVRKHFSNADALIADADVDAVYIATPPDSHKAYALKVAAAGKPCCIEKPLAPTHRDCLAIQQAFAARDLPLFVAYYRRSLPRFDRVREWIDGGRIGAVRHVDWRLMRAPSEVDLAGAYNWRTDPAIAPGGYFDDLASHGLDLFAHLFGDVKRVFGLAANQQGLYPASDAVVACWMHAGGVTGAGSWNFGCAVPQDTVDVVGSAGSIRFSVFDQGPLVLLADGRREEVFIEHPENIQRCHVENMRKHLDGEMTHPSTGATACHTGWVMDEILAGRPIPGHAVSIAA